MTFPGLASYGLGALLVLLAGAAVLLPRIDLAAGALLAAVLAACLFEVLTGALLLGLVQLAAAGGPVALLLLAGRRSRHPLFGGRIGLRPRLPGALAAALLAIALLATLGLTRARWAPGGLGGSVAEAVRHAGLVGVLTALAGLLACAAGALAIGRLDPEERRHDRSREERQLREQRARRRREDRVAARAARPRS